MFPSHDQGPTSAATFTTSYPTQNTNVLYPLVGNHSLYRHPVLQNFFEIPASFYRNNYPVSLKLKYIIDKIFKFAGYTFNSTFFDSTDFNNIYFDLGTQLANGDLDANVIHEAGGEPSDVNTNSAAYEIPNTQATATNFPMSDVQNPTGGLNSTLQSYTMQFFGDLHCVGAVAADCEVLSSAANPTLFVQAVITGNTNAALNGTFIIGS